jgi:glycosyltransferase involved in cell wall biosynthesis
LSEKIKVVNIIPSLQDGGIEAQLPRLYRALGNEKYEFYVYCLANIEHYYPVERFEKLGCKVETFNFVNVNRKFYHTFTNLIQIFKLAYKLKKGRFEVVNYHDFFSATMSRIALIIARFMFYKPQRSILTLHNMQFWLGGAHRAINKVLSSVTDKVICVSKSVYNFSKENDKLKENKYILVMNGIDITEFVPEPNNHKLRNELKLEKNSILIGQVGTFSIRKGQKYLVEAFINIHKEYNDTILVIVGGYRKHEPEIYNEVKQLIKEHRLEDRIRILKTRDDIINVYNGLDLYVMPSVVEGFGLALAEAMACEKVCIASDIPPFKEIITEGYDGFFFNSGDVDSLTKVLKKVLDNPGSLNAIGKNARKTIVERFSNESMVKQYDILYS